MLLLEFVARSPIRDFERTGIQRRALRGSEGRTWRGGILGA